MWMTCSTKLVLNVQPKLKSTDVPMVVIKSWGDLQTFKYCDVQLLVMVLVLSGVQFSLYSLRVINKGHRNSTVEPQ